MLRLHGSYQLDQLSSREVGMKILKILLHKRDEFAQYERDEAQSSLLLFMIMFFFEFPLFFLTSMMGNLVKMGFF